MAERGNARTLAVRTQLERGLADALGHTRASRWGGRRKGAGRKRIAPRANVRHRVRPHHHEAHPVHVTLRGKAGLPSFRQQRVTAMVRSVLRDQRTKRYADEFRVVELTIQNDQLQMVIEASATGALRSGVSGLVIAFARRLNKMLGRRGKVWADRWRGRELTSPRALASALAHVFRGLDEHLASAQRAMGAERSSPQSFHARGLWPGPGVKVPPRTWLLGGGWGRGATELRLS